MKRSRTDYEGNYTSRQKQAAAIGAKVRGRYPYSKYGTAHYLRGGAESLGMFGPSYKEASIPQRGMRQSLGFSGKGMYMGGRGGYWGRKIGGLFGRAALGDKLGDIGGSLIRQFVPGGNLAMTAANAASRVMTGQGEYISNNLVRGGDPIPSFVPQKDGSSVIISHREYIGDVYAPPARETFQNTAYSVNPGLERTFPWLSQVAQNYDEYTIHQLMFSYRSTVSDFAASTGQIGQVIMATIYNASSDPFSDKAAMMQYDSSMSTKTSESMIHGVECDPKKLSGPMGRFVRSNPVLVGQDINQYDHGLFNIAVTETPTGYENQAMGELWVSYTVELRKPKFFTNRGLGISRDVFASVALAAGITQNQPFGILGTNNTVLSGQQNNIGGRLIQGTGSDFVPGGLLGLTIDENNNITFPSTGSQLVGFKYVFPANYAGYVRIVFRTTNTLPSATTMACYGEGNVFKVNDVIGGPTDAFISGGSGNLGARVSTQWFDVRVDMAANGVDNTVYFTSAAPGGSTVPTTNAFLDVQEYNLGLSYKQDGTRDQLILVDQSGTVQNL